MENKLLSTKQVKNYLKKNHDNLKLSTEAIQSLNEAFAKVLDSLAISTIERKKRIISKEIIEDNLNDK